MTTLQASPFASLAGDHHHDRATTIAHIAAAANRIRVNDLTMVTRAGLGHLGGDFSATDILAVLYLGVLDITKATANHPDRDRFVLSKGHVAAALYCTLAEAGFLDESELATFLAPLSRLSGHPDRRKVPGVETNTGPLGHGFPVAVGIALGGAAQGKTFRTFALCGDGELQEGSMWEAAMLAGNRKLDRLTLIVDRNRLQQGASTETTNGLDPLDAKFAAFGWDVSIVDGHDVGALLDAFAGAPSGRPRCVIANTIKGRGVSFMENKAPWHHKIPTVDEFQQALVELRQNHEGVST